VETDYNRLREITPSNRREGKEEKGAQRKKKEHAKKLRGSQKNVIRGGGKKKRRILKSPLQVRKKKGSTGAVPRHSKTKRGKKKKTRWEV